MSKHDKELHELLSTLDRIDKLDEGVGAGMGRLSDQMASIKFDIMNDTRGRIASLDISIKERMDRVEELFESMHESLHREFKLLVGMSGVALGVLLASILSNIF